MGRKYLIWLEWPEKCFRVDAEALRYFKSLVPTGSRVVRVRSERAFLRELGGATHVVTWHFKSEWFGRAPELKLLATPGAGRELVSEKGPKGVRIHFGAYHGALIAESVAGFLLAWSRGFFAVRRAPCGWPRVWLSDKCRALAGTRALIVGYGHVGRAIGAKLETLGVETYGLTRHGNFKGRQRLAKLPASASFDWLILALPSTTGTDDWLDAKRLARLSRRCVVVNVGRGNAVDEKALVAALRSGRIAGAYLDVCKAEPTAVRRQGTIDPLDPQVPNLVLMPHSCAFDPDYLKMCFKELKDEGLI